MVLHVLHVHLVQLSPKQVNLGFKVQKKNLLEHLLTLCAVTALYLLCAGTWASLQLSTYKVKYLLWTPWRSNIDVLHSGA